MEKANMGVEKGKKTAKADQPPSLPSFAFFTKKKRNVLLCENIHKNIQQKEKTVNTTN